jgi:uncharacterized protein
VVTSQHKEDFGDDIFVIPDNGEFIVYSPLRQVVFKANSRAVKEIQAMLADTKEDCSDEFAASVKATGLLNPLNQEEASSLFLDRNPPLTRVSLALTRACDLACIYCYASCGDSDVVMSEDLIYESIRFVAENSKREGLEELRLGFHGTGEATLVWKLLDKGVSYAEHIAERYDLQPAISLITNGVNITPERADYIADHDIHLSLSLDGYREIQDIQRPKRSKRGSFDKVMLSVKTLQAKGIKFAVRATCTQYNINHLSEIVEFFASEVFLGRGGKVHIEPVELCGRAVESGIQNIDPDVFIENYKKAVLVGEANGVRLNCSGDLKAGYQQVFCGANGNNFIALPDGKITCCSRVTTPDHELADIFIYGSYDDEGKAFTIDQNRLDRLQQFDVNRYERCRSCFCKWHCAGNCIVRSMSSEGHWDMMCYVTRELVKWRLNRLVEYGKA